MAKGGRYRHRMHWYRKITLIKSNNASKETKITQLDNTQIIPADESLSHDSSVVDTVRIFFFGEFRTKLSLSRKPH